MYARLGADLTRDQQWSNLIGAMEDVNNTPLPANASPDTVATRQLLINTLARAENTLQGTDQAAADAAYADAVAQYQQFAAQQHQKEMPSGFALWLANLGLNLANPAAKLALYGALGLGAYLVIPAAVGAIGRAGGSKSWNPPRRRRQRRRHG